MGDDTKGIVGISPKGLIHILCLEDNEHDRVLLSETLQRDGMHCKFSFAGTRLEFESALGHGGYDLIISDYSLPQYDGLTALATVRKVNEEVPFIFVSGTIGEERAIESLKNGATDYVLKDRGERLVSAIRRALRESQERTEKKQLQDQLRQAQKMEAIGQLAGGVAHDFNNLLAAIQGNADLALTNADKLDELTRDNLNEIAEASRRATTLTRQLLAFGRKQAMQPTAVNFGEVVGNLIKMLKRIIGEQIRLEYRADRSSSFVFADVGMMEQILLNLAINARDAMPYGGELIMSTKRIRVGRRNLQANPEAKQGEYVCLRVRDNGCGIPAQILPRIFEPFFTTKEIGKGTGLGLATVHGIVKQHQGWIRVSSQVTVGTVFRIYLPVIAPPPIQGIMSPAAAQKRPSL